MALLNWPHTGLSLSLVSRALSPFSLCSTLPFLVPLLFRLLHALNPPPYSELIAPTPAQLHRVFFSGQPHVVFCTNRTAMDVPRMVRRVAEAVDDLELQAQDAAAVEPPSAPQEVLEDVTGAPDAAPLPKFVSALTKEEREKAYRDGVVSSPLGTVQVATMDCDAPLPRSGVSVISRFKLPAAPLFALPPGAPASAASLLPVPAFFVSNGNKPQWLPAEMLAVRDEVKTPRQILAHVAARGAPRTQALQSEKFLHRDCLSRRHCALILHSGASGLLSPATVASIRALHAAFPFVHVATMDVRGYTLSLQRNLGQLEEGAARGTEERHKWPRLLYFRRYTPPTNATIAAGGEKEKEKAPASTLLVKSFKGRFSPRPVLSFISSLADVPSFQPSGLPEADGAAAHLSPKGSGASRMAILKTAPTLNSGANNFKKAPSAAKMRKEAAERAAAQRQAKAAQQAAAAAAAKVSDAESRAAHAREERERLERRRAQMEAEAAEINFVQAASDADDESPAAHGLEEAEEDAEEETLDLDEDDKEL